MRIFWNSVFVTMAASSLACSSGDPVSIGKDAPEATAKTGEFLADYGGDWDGYIEGSIGPGGSDLVHVTLDENGQGYVEFGDAPSLAPPTDPEQAYPPDSMVPSTSAAGLHDGFHYSVLHASVESRRIRFDVEPSELYKAWCELQTSYHNTIDQHQPEYACLPPSPDGGGSQDNGTCYLGKHSYPDRVEVSCAQVTYCVLSPQCACGEEGCTSNGETSRLIDGVLENDGNDFVGTLIGWGTVRLTRQ